MREYRRIVWLFTVVAWPLLVAAACSGPFGLSSGDGGGQSNGSNGTLTYQVAYEPNGADHGEVPHDDTQYQVGDEVLVLGNTLGLEKEGYRFEGWNTSPDGNGTSHPALGEYIFGGAFMLGSSDVTLYAEWTEKPELDTVPKIIFDSDYGPDVDDLVAHAVLHRFADLGEAEIIANVVSISNEKSPGAMDAVNTWHGRPEIPVGGFTGTVDGDPLFPGGGAGSESDGEAWAISIYDAVQTYPRTITSSSYDDALSVYREALSGADDGSVRIVTVGMLSTLSELLDSPADGIDPRTGMELVEEKVEGIYIMGGRNTWREFNMRHAPSEAANVADNSPVPLYWSQFEIGHNIKSGTWADPLEAGDPEPGHIIRYGMEAFDHGGTAAGEGRHSWDAMNVLAAVRGQDGGFSFDRGAMSIDPETGESSWEYDSEGPHFRASRDNSQPWYEALLDSLVFSPRVQ